jgi:hypothetical protein
MNTEKNIPLSQIIFRFFTGVGAGFSGSVIFTLIGFMGWSIIDQSLSAIPGSINEFGVTISETSVHPLFVYLIMLTAFLSIIASSTTYTLLMVLVEDRFSLKSTALTHTFFGNLILMIIMIPGYLIISNNSDPNAIRSMVIIHFLISGIFTFLVLETLHWSKHFLINIYALIIAISFYFIATANIDPNSNFLVLLTMPILFGFLAMSNSLTTAIYQWVFRTYGTDVLNTETRFGSDYEDNARN